MAATTQALSNDRIIQAMNEGAPVEYIVAATVRALLRVHHLNRDVVIGFIGERGGGKSLGAALVAVLDWGLLGDVIRSNMQITADIEAPGGYGTAHYESVELNKHKFLNFNPEYFGSVFVIDEINLWLADAYRSMSTQNLLADDMVQQLRKLETPLFYTCIHEMFVDRRIRDMTDIFIKTKDTALTPNGLRNKQRQGISFEWIIYAISKKLDGHSYEETQQKLGPYSVSGKMLWGLIDTWQHQERKKYKPEEVEGELPVHIIEDTVVINTRSKWGWLYEKILALHDSGLDEILSTELWPMLQLEARGYEPSEIGTQLSYMGITYRLSGGRKYYLIDTFDLSKGSKLAKKLELYQEVAV